MKKTYQELKADAREKAIDWQIDFSESSYSWEYVIVSAQYFERLGRRYGLLREFRENGIC